ncbi:hypothetical protein HZS_4335 [Henneguya salminicola]|nr:hypothetical protein HZS_4335 [Henneguya salminicola]
MNARDLYSSNVQSFVVMGRIFLSGNEFPKFDTYDTAITDRLVVIPFERCFVPTPKNKNERPIDAALNHRVQTDIKYRQGHYTAAPIVNTTPSTDKIWFRSNIEYTPSPGQFLTLSNLYDRHRASDRNRCSRNKLACSLSYFLALYQTEYLKSTYDSHIIIGWELPGYVVTHILNC